MREIPFRASSAKKGRERPGYAFKNFARTAAAKRLAPHETLIRDFDCEFAPCDCFTHLSSTVDCTVVGRGPKVGPTDRNHVFQGTCTHRCLVCDVTWEAWYRPHPKDAY